MTITLSIEPLAVMYLLQQAGYEAYIVGGAVRDLLRSSQLDIPLRDEDFDFTTNATPEHIQAVFVDSFYENKFGTVSVTSEHLRELIQLPALLVKTTEITSEKQRVIDIARASKIHQSLQGSSSDPATQNDTTINPEQTTLSSPHPYEITTFRSDGVYTDHRRPEEVTWGSTLEEDLARRDFTINAMAIKIDPEFLSSLFAQPTNEIAPEVVLEEAQYSVIDPHNGLKDIAEHTIQTVGDPHKRLEEDALRMLRAVRFAVQLNMQIAEATYQAITSHSALIQHISSERIREELNKMLISDYPKAAIELLDEAGLLQYILPELLLGKNVQQGGHHTTDVWTHALDALDSTPAKDPVVRLATLLHDIAKPNTHQVIDGKPTFYNHEIIGSRIAKKIAQRLKYSHKDTDRIFALVRYHMFHYQPDQTDAAIRRFMRKVGMENIDDILDLREGDRLGSGARKTSWRLEEMKERMIEQLNQPLDVTDLAINGHDLITELNLKPGPIIGTLLHSLFEEVLENPELNTKEQLLAKAQQALAHQDSAK